MLKKISLENVLKEILPIYSRYMTMDISELPVDALSKIVAYQLGDPKYMRLKHNKGLKQIQKRYRQIYRDLKRHVGFDEDDEYLYDCYTYSQKTKNKDMSRINDVLKEVDYIKSIMKESHMRYIQPDMDCNVNSVIDCFVKMNEEDIPTRFYYNIHYVCFLYPDFKEDGEFNVTYILEDLHATLQREVEYFACSKYDDVIVEDLYIKVGIMVDTEEYSKQE